MAHILVLHGPNLNLLGQREPNVYGVSSLAEINQTLRQQAELLGHELTLEQSNAEHELINIIHHCPDKEIEFIIFNPAAFTHTSIALRDALLAIKLPFIEVHLSNIYQREPFRQNSYLADIALGVISGFGAKSYELALSAADQYLTKTTH